MLIKLGKSIMDKNDNRLTSFRGDELSCIYDEVYKSKIYRYSNIDDIEWSLFLKQPNVPVRVILWEKEEKIPVDFLFVPRINNNLLVGFHGAEVRPNVNLPKFQFLGSFMNERSESLLFFSDSTLLLNEKLVLGWMVGHKESHLLSRAISVLRILIASCGYNQTTLIGHSGGGFTAIAMGSQIQNSRAIAVNGQVVIGEYEPWTVRSLHQNVFPEEKSSESMIVKYEERLDLRSIIRNRVTNSNFVYFAHKDDISYTIPHFKLLADSMKISHEGGINKNQDKLVLCDWRISGSSAHALPGTIMPFIQFALGETSKMDIRPITPNS